MVVLVLLVAILIHSFKSVVLIIVASSLYISIIIPAASFAASFNNLIPPQRMSTGKYHDQYRPKEEFIAIIRFFFMKVRWMVFAHVAVK